MFQIEHNSRKPIYEQICEQATLLISSNVLKPNEKLPSVRTLSVTLSVNPNTIQRAYSDLCRSGILYSVGGKGCFVSENAKQVISKKAENDLLEFRICVEKMRISGISSDKLKSEINEIYSGGNNK